MAERENSEYADFTRRIVRTFAERVGDGDLEALPQLLALRAELDNHTARAVARLRAEPHLYSTRQIAERLGMTRQAVIKRWPQPADMPGRRVGGQPTGLR